MNGIHTRVYAFYPFIIPFAVWAVSKAGELLANTFPAFVEFAADTQRITVSFTATEVVGGIVMGMTAIWAVFTKWGVKPPVR